MLNLYSDARIYKLAKELGHNKYISSTSIDWIYEQAKKLGYESDEDIKKILLKTIFDSQGNAKICRTERDKELFRLKHNFRKDFAMWYGESKKLADNSLKNIDELMQKHDELEREKYLNNIWLLIYLCYYKGRS